MTEPNPKIILASLTDQLKAILRECIESEPEAVRCLCEKLCDCNLENVEDFASSLSPEELFVCFDSALILLNEMMTEETD